MKTKSSAKRDFFLGHFCLKSRILSRGGNKKFKVKETFRKNRSQMTILNAKNV
jgi:hypothetical protein